MNPKRNKFLVAVSLVIVAVVGISVWLIVKESSPPTSDDPTAGLEPELGGPEIVTLKNSEELARVLLPTQFDVTKKAINDYLSNVLDVEVKEVTIGKLQISNNGGVVSFNITIGGSAPSEFLVSVDRYTHYDKIIFSVPSKNYSIIHPVY